VTGIRVLIVDDEPQIQRVLRPALTACGYEVLEATTGRDALRIIAASAPDIAVVDLGLLDMDGKEVLREARAFSKIPIIVLSARDREAEKIMALDSGADDYVEKPFGIGELMARLRAASRHAAQDGIEPTRIESGGLCIDSRRCRVCKTQPDRVKTRMLPENGLVQRSLRSLKTGQNSPKIWNSLSLGRVFTHGVIGAAAFRPRCMPPSLALWFIPRRTIVDQYVALDVSLQKTAVCVLNVSGRVLIEADVPI
jgi:CheY-like chemotaxis protein